MTKRVMWVQTSGGVTAGLDRIVFSGEQEVIMGVRVGVNQELLGIRSRGNKGALRMDLILVLPGHWRGRISKGGDVVFNVVDVTEVQHSDPLPEHGFGSDGLGSAARVIHLRVIRAGCHGWLGIGVVLAQHEGADALLGA
jgi:hypothetical protein